MDDWSLSDHAQAAARDQAPNQPRPVTAPLTPARPFMDDFHPSREAAIRSSSKRYADSLGQSFLLP